MDWMDDFLLYFLGQRSIFGKQSEQYILTGPNIVTVAFIKVRTTTGKLERRARDHANSSPVTEESKDPISLLILVPSAACVHVASHTTLISPLQGKV